MIVPENNFSSLLIDVIITKEQVTPLETLHIKLPQNNTNVETADSLLFSQWRNSTTTITYNTR